MYKRQAYDLLETVGRKRGMLMSGGVVNTERAAITLVDEYFAVGQRETFALCARRKQYGSHGGRQDVYKRQPPGR